MRTPSIVVVSLVALLLSSISLHPTLADPLYTLCSNTAGNYSASDGYAETLQTLVDTLVDRAEATGFGTAVASAGSATSYGLALCRGDVIYSKCKACVIDAAKQLRQGCPTEKEAIVWYDNCMVRYAARDFIGSLENGFRFYMWIPEAVPDPASFNAKVVNLLKRVASEAYGDEEKLFGTEPADVVVGGKKEKLYSLAQCTRDIQPGECKRCLQDIIGDFPSYFDGNRGGRVLTASCNYRYELYRFY